MPEHEYLVCDTSHGEGLGDLQSLLFFSEGSLVLVFPLVSLVAFLSQRPPTKLFARLAFRVAMRRAPSTLCPVKVLIFHLVTCARLPKRSLKLRGNPHVPFSESGFWSLCGLIRNASRSCPTSHHLSESRSHSRVSLLGRPAW